MGSAPVGADDSVGPLRSCEFCADFRKNGAFCRADVGIGPYTTPEGFPGIGPYGSPEGFPSIGPCMVLLKP